jgi:hypothetical protein
MCPKIWIYKIKNIFSFLKYFVQLLFAYFEDVVIEEHVKFFVGVVDAQLLEGVRVEVFETEDVQDTDEFCLVVA